MTIEAELPDGTILEFPDGTDTAVITNTVKRQLRSAPRAPAPVSAQPRTIPSELQVTQGNLQSIARGENPRQTTIENYRSGWGLGDKVMGPSITDQIMTPGAARASISATPEPDPIQPINPDGIGSRIAALFDRGVQGTDAGIYNFAASLSQFGADMPKPWLSEQDAAAVRDRQLRRAWEWRDLAAEKNAASSTPITGEVQGDELWKNPSLGAGLQFVAEQGVTSLPGMLTAMAASPFYAASMTGQISNQRAQNNGDSIASMEDVKRAIPFALGSMALERVGGMGILESPAKTALGSFAKATMKEGGTEFGQTMIEDAGGVVGTKGEYNLGQSLKNATLAGIAGMGMGGGGHAIVKAPSMVGGTIKAGAQVLERRRAAREQAQAQQEMAVGAQLVDALTQNAQPATEPLPVVAGPARPPVVNTPLGGGDAPAAKPVEPAAAVPPILSPVPAEPTAAQPVVQPAAAPEPPAAQAVEPAAPAQNTARVRTPTGDEIDVEHQIVDARSLKAAEGELQNRNRDKMTTDLQVNDIVSKFDPALLGQDNFTDRGAPIVGPDNVIESGNGRMMALNRIFDQHPDKAEAYRQFLESQGYDTTGIERPVLVRRRVTELTPEQRRAFVIGSNKDVKMSLSRVEQARSDADLITPDAMALYRGGDIAGGGNAQFVERVMKGFAPSEINAMVDKDGRLSQEGVSRIQNAILARAYDNDQVLSRVMEQTDNNTKTVSNAMVEVAPQWAEMRAAVKAGEISPEYDITDKLAEAAAMVADARGDGTKTADLLNQIDAFNPMDPTVEALIRAFHNEKLTRFASQKKVADILRDYARLAAEQGKGEDMFGPVPKQEPAALLRQLLNERDNGDQMGLGIAAEDAIDEPRPQRRKAADAADMLDVEDHSGIQADNKGGYADSFAEASYTDRASVYEGAIRAIGMEPDKFRALAPDRQARLLADALKKLTGINVEIEPDLQLRLAIDQLLDAHQSIQAMAYTLGVSPRAIGLGGKLGLRLLRKSGRIRYLGVFRSDQNEIGLPGRSNSFAHEWAHALDWHLLGKVSDEMARGLTGKVREEGADFQPQNVREAFVNLLNAMFFDNAAMAQKIMRLEEQIAATKSAKRKAELQAQIDNYKAGRSQAKERSQYWKGADATNKAGGNGDYWTQPTEMFARAFEAYVSWRVGQEGHGTEFIGKGDTNYRSNPEDRFAKTFPKDEERERIFQAINDLMFQLHKESLIDGDGTPGSLPSRDDITRLTDLDHYMREVENGSLIQRETEEIKREMRQRGRAAAGRAPDPKNFAQRAQDVVANYFYSMAAKLRMIEKRYNSAAVKRIHDLLAWTPGKGEGIGATFHEAVDMRTKIQLNRVSNAMRQAGIKEMTAEVDAELRKAMTGDGYKGSPEIMDLAARLRKILDEEFYQNQRAGIDIGYIRDQGYLPRMLDLPRVLNDEAKFTKQATDTYEHVWNRDYGEDAQTLLAEPKATNLFMRILKAIDPDAHKDIKKLRKQISRLESQVSTSDDPDALLAKLEKLHAQLTELVDDALPGVRRSWATEAADKWLANLKFGADYDFDSHAPDSTYTKKRVLPKEADELLADFYIQSQMETISRYLTQSVRRTEYAKRFGAKGEKLEEMLREASAQGVSSEDITEIRRVVAVAAGRQKSDTPRSVQRFVHGFHNIYTMALLGRVVISSAVEPLTAGITAGDFRVGIKALSATLAGQKSLNGKQRAELARAMGIVMDHGADTILTERFGGEWGETIQSDKWLSQLMVRTGLHALTRAQRTHTLAVAHAYLDNLSMRVLDFAKDDAEAKMLLKELGISDPETFAQEMKAKGGMPTVEDLDSKWGMEYALASKRFIDMTIQEPNPMMRPQMANSPVGRIVYGIMSFSMSFWRNVMKRQGLLLREAAKRGALPLAVKLTAILASAVPLFIGQTIMSALRELLLNPLKWEEKEKEGTLYETLVALGFVRSFSFGMADPILQGYTGLKYQRDLSNILIGPAPGFFLQNTQAMLMPSVRNSEKTNTAEFNAARAFYNISIGPATSIALTYVPGGPVIQGATGVGMAVATSPAVGTSFAEALVGPKDSKKKKTRKHKEGG